MSSYSGKMFEQDFKDSFKGTKYEKGLMRLYDCTSGFAGITTPCDYIMYSYPSLFMFELKACQGTRLDFAKVRENQIEGLNKWSENKGVIAGVVVNFYEYGDMYFIPIKLIDQIRESGRKSITRDMCEEYCYPIDGSKRRTRFRINGLKTIEDLRSFEFKNYVEE